MAVGVNQIEGHTTFQAYRNSEPRVKVESLLYLCFPVASKALQFLFHAPPLHLMKVDPGTKGFSANGDFHLSLISFSK